MIKETLKKTGVVRGADLERMMFDLNSMSHADGSGAPVDLFLGRIVSTFLPNAGNKFISMRKEVEKRKSLQENWMKKLGRVSSSEFKIGDLVHVQDMKTGMWDFKEELKRWWIMMGVQRLIVS